MQNIMGYYIILSKKNFKTFYHTSLYNFWAATAWNPRGGQNLKVRLSYYTVMSCFEVYFTFMNRSFALFEDAIY